jgi:dUTP pyrophosphatase
MEEFVGELIPWGVQNLKVAKMVEYAKLPTRKHDTDAGLDLYVCARENEHWVIPAGKIQVISAGIGVQIPDGYVGLIWPKSRSNFLIGGGVVDSGYRGEILVKVINVSDEAIEFSYGDAVAQLVIQPVETPVVEEVTWLELQGVKTDRGTDGGIVRQVNHVP